MTDGEPAVDGEQRLREAAKQLRLYGEEQDDQEAEDLARLIELGEFPEYDEVARLRELMGDVHEWRQQTVPDAEPFDQAAHTAGEAQEVVDLYVKGKQYEGYPTSPDSQRLVDEAGDVFISHLSFCAMIGLDPIGAIEESLGKIRSDDWQEDRGLGE